MKALITILLFTFAVSQSNAQTLISEFLFNSNPVTRANVGPNALSVSSSAGSSTGGVNSNGLNAKASGDKGDIDLTIKGSTFDVRGIDISVSFKRSESEAYFFTRGSSLIFGMTDGYLGVTYRVVSGNTYATVTSGSVYEIPSDEKFKNYRFIYNPSTGVGALKVDGVTVWTNNGPDNRNLYWTGAGNAIVGQLMDGNGYSKTILDNLRIYSITNTALPIELLGFNAVSDPVNGVVNFDWATASERNNDYFTIERSIDGTTWETIEKVNGAGNSSTELAYGSIDSNPLSGVLYYRLKQTDFDGKFEYSDIVSVQIDSVPLEDQVNVYPNPAVDFVNVSIKNTFLTDNAQIRIVSISGNVVFEQSNISDYNSRLDVSALAKGNYTVEVVSGNSVARATLIKL